MPIKIFPQEHEKFEIQVYKKPKSLKLLKETHIAFTGSPRKHPYDPEKIILVIDPYSTNTFYYEFQTDTISYVEELPSIVNLDGKTISMVRLWIKKMSIGVRCTPFIIQETGLTSKPK